MHVCVYERERGSVVGREGERGERGKEGEGGRGKRMRELAFSNYILDFKEQMKQLISVRFD